MPGALIGKKITRAGRGVMLLASGSSVTAMKLESESVGIAMTCHLERNKRTFGNDDRQEWSLIGKIQYDATL